MALTAGTQTLLNTRRDQLESGLAKGNTIGTAAEQELFLIEYLLGEIGGATVTGGVTVDNSGIESRLGNVTDAIVAAGAEGSLSAKLRRVSQDLGSIQSLYGSDPNQAGSATGDLMQRLRAIAEASPPFAIAENTANNNEIFISFDATGTPSSAYDLTAGAALGSIPATLRYIPASTSSGGGGGGVPVTYSVVGGASGLSGAWDIANSQVYPIDGSAAIPIGTAAGNATNLAISGGSSTSTTSTIQTAIYDVVAGASGLTGYLKNDIIYPTIEDAITETNALVRGTGNGEVSVTGLGDRIDYEVRAEEYTASTTETGITTGDALTYWEIINPVGPTVTVTEVWYNQTTNAIVSEPTSPTPTGVSTAAPPTLLESRAVELPALLPTPDTAQGAVAGTQFLRPAAPTAVTNFFSGANTIPANTTFVTLEIGITDDLFNSAGDSDAQRGNVQAILNEVGLYTTDGTTVPAASDTAPEGTKLAAGWTYVFPLAIASNLKIAANANSAAAINERGFAQIKFYSGDVPELRVFESSRRDLGLLTVSGGGSSSSTVNVGTPIAPTNSDTGVTPNTWVELFPANANRRTYFIRVATDAAAPVAIGRGTVGNEISLDLIPAGRAFGAAQGDLSIDTDRLVVRSSAASVSFTAHSYVGS